MRIHIRPSAKQHGITDTEIRTIINHYEIRIPLTPRLSHVDTQPTLFIGRLTNNEPEYGPQRTQTPPKETQP